MFVPSVHPTRGPLPHSLIFFHVFTYIRSRYKTLLIIPVPKCSYLLLLPNMQCTIPFLLTHTFHYRIPSPDVLLLLYQKDSPETQFPPHLHPRPNPRNYPLPRTLPIYIHNTTLLSVCRQSVSRQNGKQTKKLLIPSLTYYAPLPAGIPNVSPLALHHTTPPIHSFIRL